MPWFSSWQLWKYRSTTTERTGNVLSRHNSKEILRIISDKIRQINLRQQEKRHWEKDSRKEKPSIIGEKCLTPASTALSLGHTAGHTSQHHAPDSTFVSANRLIHIASAYSVSSLSWKARQQSLRFPTLITSFKHHVNHTPQHPSPDLFPSSFLLHSHLPFRDQGRSGSVTVPVSEGGALLRGVPLYLFNLLLLLSFCILVPSSSSFLSFLLLTPTAQNPTFTRPTGDLVLDLSSYFEGHSRLICTVFWTFVWEL